MKNAKLFYLLFVLIVLPVFAHSNEDHNKKGKPQEIQGHLVELSCYLKHDAIGEKHRDCAKDCAEKGLPLGLLTKDGTLYHIMGEGHEDLRSVNKKLLDYLEQDVRVVGETFEKNHTHVVVIQKIKKL
jgi:hypothetical protein